MTMDSQVRLNSFSKIKPAEMTDISLRTSPSLNSPVSKLPQLPRLSQLVQSLDTKTIESLDTLVDETVKKDPVHHIGPTGKNDGDLPVGVPVHDLPDVLLRGAVASLQRAEDMTMESPRMLIMARCRETEKVRSPTYLSSI